MGARAAAIGDRIRRHIADAAKMLVLQIDRELRRLTPIDTGHARRNWVPSIGAPNTTIAKDDSVHDRGVTEVLSYKLEQGALWVANMVDYVVFLNYGSSDQRAAGWIELAVDTAFQKVQERLSRAGKTEAAAGVGSWRSEYQSAVGGSGADNLAGAYSPFGGEE